jgi:hypothetical protein
MAQNSTALAASTPRVDREDIRLARAISAPCSAARCACRWPTLTTSRAVVVEDRIQHSTATSPAVQPGRMHTHNNHR